MPKIPTIFSDANLRGGAVAPEANPLAFNSSAGLEQLGSSIAGTGELAARIHAKKVSDDEDRWIVNASHAYNIEAAKFEQENKGREDFAQATFDHLEGRKKEFLAKAPSQRAATHLQAQLDNVIESRYHQAVQVGDRTKLVNAHIDIDKNVNDAMAAYRADAGSSLDYAEKNLRPQMDLLKASVMTRWEKTHPEHASKLLNNIEEQFIIGTGEHDPALARKLLDESNFIDVPRRAQLLNYIEGQEKAGNRVARMKFADDIAESIELAKRTNEFLPDVPLASFEVAYGKEDAPVAKQHYDTEQTKVNQASGFLKGVAGMNPGALLEAFGKFASDPKIMEGAKRDAAQSAQAMIQQANTDPHSYQAQYDPEISKAYQFARELPPDQRSAGLARAHRLALEKQGYPSPDLPASEQAHYLNLPTNARHLMSKEEAKRTVLELSAGSPEQQLDAIAKNMATYPEELRAVAFNDMVLLGKLEQGVQWAFLHRDKTWVKEYMGAQKADSIKSLSPERKKDFEDALFGDKNWGHFAQTLLGDSAQRADELSGYKDGLINYAYLLSLKGAAKSPKEAVTEASKRLIDEAFLYPKVNGLPVKMMRERRDGTIRTNKETSDMGRRLAVALETIPPTQISTTDPHGRDLFKIFPEVLGTKPLNETLPSLLRRKGFFVTRPDGQGATVYLHDDYGVPFQLMDKGGKPWEVDYDSVPHFYDTQFEGYLPYKQAPPEMKIWDELPTAYPIRPDKGGSAVRQSQQFWKNQQYPRTNLLP